MTPFSYLTISVWLIPSRAAASRTVIPACIRASRSRRATRTSNRSCLLITQIQSGLLHCVNLFARQRAIVFLDELERFVVARGRQVCVRADTEPLVEQPPAGADGRSTPRLALLSCPRITPGLHQLIDCAALCGREAQ